MIFPFICVQKPTRMFSALIYTINSTCFVLECLVSAASSIYYSSIAKTQRATKTGFGCSTTWTMRSRRIAWYVVNTCSVGEKAITRIAHVKSRVVSFSKQSRQQFYVDLWETSKDEGEKGLVRLCATRYHLVQRNPYIRGGVGL